MSLRFLSWGLFAVVTLGAADVRVLRVCADPNNLPFSNEREEGFENRLAHLVAHDLGARLEYTWWAEHRSFVKNALNSGKCDVLTGIPATMPGVAATQPYYRSTYVFVSRNLHVNSLDDPRLEKWRIGVHMVGDDYAPPSVALARRGLAANVVGYSLFGKYGDPNPPARLVESVAKGDVDAAIVWGPFAGYFGKGLEIAPVTPAMLLGVPFTYAISMGVRAADSALRDELNGVLTRECAAIQTLLSEYRVPREGNIGCEPALVSPSASSR